MKLYAYVTKDEDNNQWIGYVLAEDGQPLIEAKLGNPIYARHELGITSRQHRQTYIDYAGEGYDMVDLTQLQPSQLFTHQDFVAALNKNADAART